MHLFQEYTLPGVTSATTQNSQRTNASARRTSQLNSFQLHIQPIVLRLSALPHLKQTTAKIVLHSLPLTQKLNQLPSFVGSKDTPTNPKGRTITQSLLPLYRPPRLQIRTHPSRRNGHQLSPSPAPSKIPTSIQ